MLGEDLIERVVRRALVIVEPLSQAAIHVLLDVSFYGTTSEEAIDSLIAEE